MCFKYFLLHIGISLSALLLVSCSPGGENPTDVFPNATAVIKPTSGPDSFLLFPNPQKQADGSLQTNTLAYATAYYEAIDPNNTKDTLAKWKAANGFGSAGTEVNVVFGDVKDLGYGRRMTARDNGNDTYAFMVENYAVAPAANYTYSSLNLDAAVAREPKWHVGTNAIEFSSATCTAAEFLAGCNSTVKFAKFYTFHPTTGARLLEANLDGRGNKAMPGICISCHGGRAYPLTPATESPTSKALFPVIGFTASQKRGDVEAHLQPFDVDNFGFSTVPGYTRAEQETKFKAINKMVLKTYPIAAAPVFPEDTSRRISNFIEWDAAPAATIIKNAYGGNSMPNTTFSDTFVPPGWAGQETLYNDVVVSACRTCHILRGTGTMPELNFNSYASFAGYADQIKGHVIDRGNMPLAKIVYERLWGSSGIEILANFLETPEQTVRDTSGAVLKPGRPVAVPGPNRTVLRGATILSATGSLYSKTYQWSIVSGPNGTTLDNPNLAQPTFNATADGNYVLQLITSNGTTQSEPATLTLVVNNALSPAPATIRFSNIKAVLEGAAGCIGCHTPPSGGPPIFYTNIDRNGSGGIADTTDDLWFYTELRGRINFTDVASSALLRKPSGHHHGGGLQPGFDSTTAPGQPGRANYDLFLNWILNGAPY